MRPNSNARRQGVYSAYSPHATFVQESSSLQERFSYLIAVLGFSLTFGGSLRAEISPPGAELFLDFESADEKVHLVSGARRTTGKFGGALEFTTALQYAEVDLQRAFDGIQAMTVGGWFFPRRSGEQYFFFRGVPEIAPQGERMFRPNEQSVNFVLGTDQHGFFLGTINGNGSMPFPHVTVNEVSIDAWHQLVVVKDAQGYQKFYQNGTLVHTDQDATSAGKVWPFRDVATGEPIRLAMPLGGLIGEAWIFQRELSAEEIKQDFLAKQDKYNPALPGVPVKLREMNSHPVSGLWKNPITISTWPKERERILSGVMKVLGPFPKDKVPLDPRIIAEEDCGTYLRRKISIQVQPDDRMPAWLLIPKQSSARVSAAREAPAPDLGQNGRRDASSPLRFPAIICFYGTTNGAGKDTTVGLSGR